jgi:hypothetical protein
MPHQSTNAIRKSLFRRFWKPMAVLGTGGTTLAIWFEDALILGEEILAVIFLPVLAGFIYLLDILIFRARMPRREDLNNVDDKGAKK